jgi:hypothetical protein
MEKPRVLNKYKDKISKDDVYIGRPSKWGNPYVIGKHGTRAEVIAKHRADVLNNPAMIEMIKKELRGKNVVCFCSPQQCHGDTYSEIANS